MKKNMIDDEEEGGRPRAALYRCRVPRLGSVA
jgi:hypothetical protein